MYAAMVAIVAVMAWFAFPVLVGQYNEGFQFTIAMNADMIAHGGNRATDMLYALDNEFFWVSRFGVSLLLAGMLKLGWSALVGIRLIMGLSLVGLIWVNAAILVRHYRVHPIFACLPALLFPGLFESGWFFNDNVLSAALSSTALALFWSRRSLPASAGSGLLLGLAIAARTDAVLLAPAFAVLMWFELPTWRLRFLHALVAAPIVAIVPLALYGAWGFNLFDILPLSRRATEAWARHESATHMLHPFLKGFAPPGLLMMAFGTVSILLRRRWREIMLCLVVPLIYAAAYGRMLTEVRYILPLSPFFGILMVEGTRAVLGATRRVQAVGVAAFVFALLLCFAPPIMLPDRRLYFLSTDNDMPRPSIGRFWSPAMGIWWNQSLAIGYNALSDAVLANARPMASGVVVSTGWTADRAVDMALREHGFVGTPATTPSSCADIGEVFARADRRILHLRAHIPMLADGRETVTWQAFGAPCLNALGKQSSDRVLVVGGMPVAEPPRGLFVPGVDIVEIPTLDVSRWARVILGKSFGYYVANARTETILGILRAPVDDSERLAADTAITDRARLR